MKRILLGILSVVLLSSAAGAATCGSVAGQAIFNSGVNQGFSCSIGGLTFSNFGFVNAGNDAQPSVFFIGATVDAAGSVNFSFNPFMAVGGGFQAQDIEFTFAVSTDHSIPFVGLFLNGAFGTVTEQMCSSSPTVPGSCDAGTALTPTNGLHNASTLPNQVVTLSPAATGTFYVTKDIQLNAPSGQVGAISNITESFDIPEPTTLFLLGSGLLGFGIIRRRKRK